MEYRVLVTGAAAPAGRSMLEALRSDSVTVLACDYGGEAPNEVSPDHFFRVHRSDDPEFVGDLVTLCASHDVDVVVPTRAADQNALARVHRLFEGLGSRIWLAPIAEHATRSQARRILQLSERSRSRSTMSSWLRRVSNLAHGQTHSVV